MQPWLSAIQRIASDSLQAVLAFSLKLFCYGGETEIPNQSSLLVISNVLFPESHPNNRKITPDYR